MNQPISVTLFGNTNNEMYRFAVALKQQEILVKLVYLEEGLLHDPISLSSQALDLNSEVLRTGLSELNVIALSKSFKTIVVRETQKSDFAIFTGQTIAFANFAKSPYSLFLSGSDAILMTRYRIAWIRILASSKKFRSFFRYFIPMLLYVFLQRRSLRKASFWLSLPEASWAELKDLKLKLNCTEIVQTYLPIVLDNQINNHKKFSNGLIKVLLVGRFNKLYKNSSISLDDKGSFIALTGLLRFVRTNPNLIEFSYFSKGDISKECRTLITELAKFCLVVEKEVVTFNEFLKELSFAEVVIDSVGSSPVARNTLEALSQGKFVIANFFLLNPLDYISNGTRLKTLTFSANSSNGVFEGLEKYKQERFIIQNIASDLASEIRLEFSSNRQGIKLKNAIESNIR